MTDFRILGPLEVVEDGRTVAIPGARERALLVFLLLHANEPVTADRLIDELWGESPPASARKSLQVRIAGLRRALGKDRIVTRGTGYMLRAGVSELDIALVERLVVRADEAKPSEAADLLRTALELWRGQPLADFTYEDFAQAAAQRLEEVRLAVLARRIEADLALGREADLVPELQELVAAHPLQERLRGQLMLALYRSGRQSEALEAYREARQVLVEQVGIEPGATLRELEQAILRQDPSLVGTTKAAARSLLVLVHGDDLDRLAGLASRLAASPPREVILVSPVATADELASGAARLDERRSQLQADLTAVRSAAFVSGDPARDVLRLAAEQEADLLLLGAPESLLDDELLRGLLHRAPCDVGALVPGRNVAGPVLVPFAGGVHDWTAVEIAAWAAKAAGVNIRLAGPSVDPSDRGRDASRLLASAALALQRSLGVTTEPLLVDPEPAGLVQAAEGAGLVVLGLPDRWRDSGLGEARGALARGAEAPVLIVRRGLRPGGLAPAASHTRFTWTISD